MSLKVEWQCQVTAFMTMGGWIWEVVAPWDRTHALKFASLSTAFYVPQLTPGLTPPALLCGHFWIWHEMALGPDTKDQPASLVVSLVAQTVKDLAALQETRV